MVTHLNTRLLLILALISVTVGTGTYFLHDYQVQRNSHILKERADDSVKAGDFEEAMQLYSQYIRLAPDDLEALRSLGELIDRSAPTWNSTRRAYKVYSELIRESPNRPDARQIRYRLAQLMMSLGEYSQAENQLAMLLKLPKPEDKQKAEDNQDSAAAKANAKVDKLKVDRASVFYLLAQCEAAQEKELEALASSLSAIIEDPTKHVEYYIRFSDSLYPGAIDRAQSLGDQIPERTRMKELLEDDLRAVDCSRGDVEKLLKRFPEEAQPEPAAVTAIEGGDNQNPTADVRPGDEKFSYSKDNQSDNQAETVGGTGAETDLQTRSNEPQIVNTQPLIDYLLVQIAYVDPEIDGQIALANYFLAAEDFDGVDVELDDIHDNEEGREQPDAALFESSYELMKAGRLAREEKLDDALAAVEKAESLVKTGQGTQRFDLRFDLLLANALQQRSAYEREPEAKKSAMLESKTVLQSAIERLPEAREDHLKVEDLEKRDQKFRVVRYLENALRIELIQTELALQQSDLFAAGEVPATDVIDRDIEQLEEVTRDNGLLKFLKARQQYVQLQRQILEGPQAAGKTNTRLSWGSVADVLRDARLEVRDRPEYRRQIDLMLNRCYQELNATQSRVALFEDSLEVDGNWTAGRLELARALRDAGKFEEADGQFEIVSQQQDDVLADVAELERRQLQLRFLLTVAQEQRQWHILELPVSKLREERPNDPAVRILDAEVKVQEGRFDEAEQLMAETLQLKELTREQRIRLWKTRIVLQLIRGDRELDQRIQGATELWEAAKQELGDCVEMELVELQIAGAQSPELLKATAEKIFRSLEKYEKADRIKVLEALIAVSKSLRQSDSQDERYLQEEKDRLKSLWTELAELQPERILCRLQLCRIALQEGDNESFREELKQIRRIEGKDGPEGNFLDAAWHADRFSQALKAEQKSSNAGDYDQALADYYQPALKLLDRVQQERPGWDRVPVARFFLAGLIGEREKQAELAREAIELGARDAGILEFRLAYLNESGRSEDAVALWEQIRRQGLRSFTAEISSQLSAAYVREGELDEASAILRNSVKDGEEFRKELTEGMLKLMEYEQREVYEKTSNPQVLDQLFEEAEAHYLAAIEAAPHERDVWTRTVLFYLKTDRVAEAKAIVERAVKEMPAEPPAARAITLAECYGMLGESELAKAQYQLAKQADPDNLAIRQEIAVFAQRAGDTPLAREALLKIVELSKDSAPSVARAAQTDLSRLDGLESNTYVDAVKAIDKLDAELAKVPGTSPEERVARFQILVTQLQILRRFPVHEFQVKMAGILEEIEGFQPLPLYDRLFQITLDKMLQNIERAEQRLQALLEDEPDSLPVRVYAAEFYLGLNDPEKLDSALEQVENLEGQLPNSFVLTGLKAELAYAAPDKQEQAPAEIIQTYLSRLDEVQDAGAIFEDSVARNVTGIAFNWMLKVKSKSLQSLAARKRITEAVRLLREEKRTAARALLMPILKQKEVQRFYSAQCARECSALLERFGLLAEAERVYRDHYLTRTDDENAQAALILLMGRQGKEKKEKLEKAIQLGESILNKSNAALVVTNLEAVLRTQNVETSHQQRIKAVLDRSIEADPENVSLLHQLADYWDFVGEYEAAETTYARILGIQPNYPVALNNLAWLMSMREQSPLRSQQAKKMIDLAINTYGETAELLDTRATVEMGAGEYLKAIQSLEKSIKVTPTAEKYFHLSQAQLLCQKTDKAKESREKAMELGFKTSRLHPLEQEAAVEWEGRLTARK